MRVIRPPGVVVEAIAPPLTVSAQLVLHLRSPQSSPIRPEQLRGLMESGAAVDGGDPSIKQKLTGCTDLGPALVEHCLRQAGILAKTKCSAVLAHADTDPAMLHKLGECLIAAHDILRGERRGGAGWSKGDGERSQPCVLEPWSCPPAPLLTP